MTDSLEGLIEFDKLGKYASECSDKLREIKDLIINELSFGAYAKPILVYAKSINIDNYLVAKKMIDKTLSFMESGYSLAYSEFKELHEAKKINAMENLLKEELIKSVSERIDEIKSCEEGESNIEYCIGGCGYSGDYILNDESFFVCPNCAVVQTGTFVVQETRSYNKEEIKARSHHEVVNTPVRTVINIKDILSLSPNARKKFTSLSKIQKSLVNSLERNYFESQPMMKTYCHNLGASYLFDTAWRIYREAAKKKLTMGRTIQGFVMASIAVSAKVHKKYLSLGDILACGDSNLKLSKYIGLLNRYILKNIGIRVDFTPDITNVITKYESSLNLDMEEKNRAINIYNKAIKNGMPYQGKDPKGLAGASIYLASKESNKFGRTQSEIAKIVNVTDVTLRTRAKEIKKFVKIRAA
jgi:transcription initiation factor TFIIIB Brf1 subunit/transcription initiation factor TFIIB